MTIPALRLLAAACLAAPLLLLAQTPVAKPLAFDAISIKRAQSGTEMGSGGHMMVRVMINTPPDGFIGSNVSPRMLISIAYGLKEDQIIGPDWIGSTNYDVSAKVTSFDPPDSHQLTKDQRNQMLRSLLADRFQLTTHNETKEAPIYQLTLARGGSKLHEATPGDTYPNGPKGPDGVSHPGMMMMRQDGLTAQAVPVPVLIDMLSRQLHRPIIDKTDLTGKYDIHLQYSQDQIHDDHEAGPGTVESSGPSLFTALEEQLGLKLESTKGPVTTLVIDHIEKPSEN